MTWLLIVCVLPLLVAAYLYGVRVGLTHERKNRDALIQRGRDEVMAYLA